MRRTKIVCTIGPATRSPEALRQLVDAGMDVARVNFSHGTHEEHAETIAEIRTISRERGRSIAILQDLSGPKVRLGVIPGDGIVLKAGDELTLALTEHVGDERTIPLPVPEIFEAVQPPARLLLDDGLVELQVKKKRGDSLLCVVIVGGTLSSHKGVSLPGVSLPIASVTDKDLDDLKFGIVQKVDWIAASFVRSANDIAVLRGVCDAVRARISLIAKIEKHEAIRNIDDILLAVDGIMVARGDLGVEMPIHEVPVIQKNLIAKANRVGKPVITATQMLDSMIRNPRPTRAEATDVANAIFDGTDAIMLSGETAVGSYPFESVRMMDKIACYTETSRSYLKLQEHRTRIADTERCVPVDAGLTITQAIGEAVAEIAQDLGAAAIITATSTGRTARVVSRFRPSSPIIAATSSLEAYQRLALVWGVFPLLVGIVEDADSMMQVCVDAATTKGLVKENDVVVLTGGVPVGRAGNTDFIKVHRIGQPLQFEQASGAD